MRSVVARVRVPEVLADRTRSARPGTSTVFATVEPNVPDLVWQVAVGVLGVGVAGFLADRALLWMERRGWVYWRRRGFGSIGTEVLRAGDPATQAAERAMAEERLRKDVRPAGAPPLDVDLDAGVVRVRDTEP